VSVADPPLYGLLAEYGDATALVRATHAAREAGYRALDGYSPFPIEEMHEALDAHDRRLPFLVLLGGILGGLAGYGLCYWTSVIDYPINVGGRPFHSWPSFIPITFEMTILGAALACVLGMLALNGLPQPYHPLFGVERFARASRDQFFLCVSSRDPRFDVGETRRFLESTGATGVFDVAL
jgi:hypothetical protein